MEKNGLEIPEHLSMDFFQKTIEAGFGFSSVRIKEVDFSMGCSGGDNYSGFVYRTKVRYIAEGSENIVSLIVKCIPVEGDREVFKIINVFGKEVSMYTKILPVIQRMLSSESISEQIYPRLIYSQADPVNTIVFQDLNDLNLVLGNRIHGLDEEHAKIVLTKIGQLHAGSMVFVRDHPEYISMFEKSVFHKDADCAIRDAIFRENIADMAELVKSWDGFDEISQKLYLISDSFYDRMDKCLNGGGEPFKVLNHGDVWVNNCMFKQINGIPTDMMFIDFQMSYYASPAYDLHYFLNSSVQLNVLITKRYVLLRTYYKALRSTLEALAYENIPSWEDLKNEVRAKEFIGFWAFEAVLPLLSMSKENSADNSVESFNNEDGSRRKRQLMFTSDRFLNTIKYSLDRFDELGVLD